MTSFAVPAFSLTCSTASGLAGLGHVLEVPVGFVVLAFLLYVVLGPDPGPISSVFGAFGALFGGPVRSVLTGGALLLGGVGWLLVAVAGHLSGGCAP